MKHKFNLNEEIQKDIAKLHINSTSVALAALLTIFSLYLEHPKHSVVKPSDFGSLFEREREIHPTHGSYGARAKYATNGVGQ